MWRRPTDLLASMREKCGGSGHEAIGEIVDMVTYTSLSPETSRSSSPRPVAVIGQKVLAMPPSYLYKVSSMRKIFEGETGTRLEDALPEETGAFCEYFVTHSCVCLPLPEAAFPGVISIIDGECECRYMRTREEMKKYRGVFDKEQAQPWYANEKGKKKYRGVFGKSKLNRLLSQIILPPLLVDKRYVMAQPLGTILHACRKLGSVIGRDVAVVGQGQNGLVMSQMLANMGARRVIALDLLEERLAYLKMNGATHTLRVSASAPMDEGAIAEIRRWVEDITDGEMSDVAIDMVGHQGKTVTLCSQLAGRGGTVLLFGLPPAIDDGEGQMSVRYVDLTRKLLFVCSHSPEFGSFRLALELIEQGRFNPSAIFSRDVPFRDFVEAYEKACYYRAAHFSKVKSNIVQSMQRLLFISRGTSIKSC